jgi:2-polyprenyl-6-methoxyphenol hydroxylase-like FAD-dependent oxidoreductase
MDTTDVIIVGCGPTGAMLSALLGRYSVSNIVLEQEPDIITDPRGIALDEDSIRCLQACGIYNKIFTEIGQCLYYVLITYISGGTDSLAGTGSLQFVGGEHKDMHHKPFLSLNYATTEGGTGHPGFIFHKQPVIEKHLRDQIAAAATSELRIKCTLQSIREDNGWVYAGYSDGQERTRTIRGKFLVGCDGKTGFTRKLYLEPRGIRLEKAHQTSYEEVWVALNWKITLPTPETHPSFPLWRKDYTPQQVYDSFFPSDFRFLCNPKRAAVCGRFGMPEDMLWRFEFVVLPGEDGLEMAKEGKIKEVVWPYLKHPGWRYELKEDVKYPEDCIDILRCRPFKFEARSCNKWALNRVLICGDAAHVFPPFGGQGIASGFRDAIGLAWRLAIATQKFEAYPDEPQREPPFGKLFLAWYSERQQSLNRSLVATIENGNYVMESDSTKILIRDWSLWAMQLIPSWKHWLQLGSRREGMIEYKWEPGKEMAFLPNMRGGKNFPQVYCMQLGCSGVGSVQFSDDIIFASSKKGLFQLVVLLHSFTDFPDAFKSTMDIGTVSGNILRADEAMFIVQQISGPSNSEGESNRVYRLATAEEFSQDKELCGGRPPAQFYDPFRMTKEVEGRPFVILRPDRFVFAATHSQKDLFDAAKQLKKHL